MLGVFSGPSSFFGLDLGVVSGFGETFGDGFGVAFGVGLGVGFGVGVGVDFGVGVGVGSGVAVGVGSGVGVGVGLGVGSGVAFGVGSVISLGGSSCGGFTGFSLSGLGVGFGVSDGGGVGSSGFEVVPSDPPAAGGEPPSSHVSVSGFLSRVQKKSPTSTIACIAATMVMLRQNFESPSIPLRTGHGADHGDLGDPDPLERIHHIHELLDGKLFVGADDDSEPRLALLEGRDGRFQAVKLYRGAVDRDERVLVDGDRLDLGGVDRSLCGFVCG